MKYDIIATDLDGTLLNDSSELTLHTREVLIEAQRQGMRVVLASGRPANGMRHIAEALHLKEYGGYIMAFNGGQIIDCTTEEEVYSIHLPHTYLPLMLDKAHSHGFSLITYHGEYVVSEDEANEYINKTIHRNRLKFKKVQSFVQEVVYPINKCMIVGDPRQLEPLEKSLQTEYQGRLSTYLSDAFFLEVVPMGINKATGLKRLLEHLHESPSRLIAFGDAPNDAAMLRYAGLGVAMAQAHQAARDASDISTLTNNEDGVAAVVEKLLQ